MHPVRRALGGEQFEVVVIGGGVNGVAMARECALGGRRTLLVEQHDFASGTTSRSTRVIHGGLRYLEHGDLSLVRESLRERQRLLCERPHLVRPLNFLLALPEGGASHSALQVRLGLWLYRRMAKTGRVRVKTSEDLYRLERLLDEQRRWALFEYEDAQCEFPELLVAEWLVEALAAGAVARNHTEALEIELQGGRVRGIRLRDRLSGDEYRVGAKVVINACGPWVDALCSRAGLGMDRRLIGGIRGSHLVLRRFAGAPESALYTEAVDGRPIFVVPWNGQLLVGTTEVRDQGDPGESAPAAAETQYLMDSVQRLFPRADIGWDDVRCAFAGVRPLPFAPDKAPASVTRRHALHEHGDEGAAGMISVIGGKLTAAAALARECARKVGIEVAEPGALPQVISCDAMEATLREWSHLVAAQANTTPASARAIAAWHGRRALPIAAMARNSELLRETLCAHTDHVVAEAVDAVQNQAAITLADVLLRRVPVALGPCWSGECTRTAAWRIGEALGWSEPRIETEAERFQAERAAFLRKPEQVHLDRLVPQKAA